MTSVLPQHDPDTPLDEEWTRIRPDSATWERLLTDAGWTKATEPGDTAEEGERWVFPSPVSFATDEQARVLVENLVAALRFEYLPPAGIINVLHRMGLYDAWRADPVCLSCGLPGCFESTPRDEYDFWCVVCRVMREHDADQGWKTLLDRLECLQTRPGIRAARAAAKARAAETDQAVKRLFPEPAGRRRDDSAIEAAIRAIIDSGNEPTFANVAEYMYGCETRTTSARHSLDERFRARGNLPPVEQLAEIVRRVLG